MISPTTVSPLIYKPPLSETLFTQTGLTIVPGNNIHLNQGSIHQVFSALKGKTKWKFQQKNITFSQDFGSHTIRCHHD